MSRSFRWPRNRRLFVELRDERDPWHLTLTIPVRFNFFQEESLIPRNEWTRTEREWVARLIRLSGQRFSYQYRIEAYERRAAGSSERSLPTCRIRVRLHDITGARGTTAADGVTVNIWSTRRRAVTTHSGDRVAVAYNDLDYGYRREDGSWQSRGQRPALHEIGHVMGLFHFNCQSNAQECYHHSGIMGEGMDVYRRHYEPFAEFLNSISDGRFRWRVRQ